MDQELSSIQKRIWFISQDTSASVAYNNCMVYRIVGEFYPTLFIEALRYIVDRNEIFHKIFIIENGKVLQKHSKNIIFDFQIIDNLPQQEVIDSIAHYSFDLAKGPLIMANLVKCEEQWCFVFCMHHIISDGLSFYNFMNQIWSFMHEGIYAERMQYPDYIKRELSIPSESLVMYGAKEFWRKELLNIESSKLQLPQNYRRPDIKKYVGKRYSFDLPNVTIVKQISFKRRTTPSLVFLACYSILLHKLSGQSEIIIGVPVSGRPMDFMKSIGMFVNTLPIRVKFENNTFDKHLAELTNTFSQAYKHQFYPLEEILQFVKSDRNLSSNPLFDVLFVYQSSMASYKSEKIEYKPISYTKKTSMFDILFEVYEIEDRFSCDFEFDTHLFDIKTIEVFVEYLKQIYFQILENPAIEIKSIKIR